MLAEAAPLDCGAKLTVNERLWPASSAAGKEIPLTLNSALVLVTEETVTGAPAAFRLAFKEAPEPTTMVPKERATGLAERVPFGP